MYEKVRGQPGGKPKFWGHAPVSPVDTPLTIYIARLNEMTHHVSLHNVIITLDACNGKRNVTVWHSSVRLSVCPVNILTVTHEVAACNAASVYFGPTIRRTDLLVYRLSQTVVETKNDILT